MPSFENFQPEPKAGQDHAKNLQDQQEKDMEAVKKIVEDQALFQQMEDNERYPSSEGARIAPEDIDAIIAEETAEIEKLRKQIEADETNSESNNSKT